MAPPGSAYAIVVIVVDGGEMLVSWQGRGGCF
jgi:hypothetical protein